MHTNVFMLDTRSRQNLPVDHTYIKIRSIFFLHMRIHPCACISFILTGETRLLFLCPGLLSFNIVPRIMTRKKEIKSSTTVTAISRIYGALNQFSQPVHCYINPSRPSCLEEYAYPIVYIFSLFRVYNHDHQPAHYKINIYQQKEDQPKISTTKSNYGSSVRLCESIKDNRIADLTAITA